MSADSNERLEELCSHYLEDEVDSAERTEVEAWLSEDADAKFEADLERALMAQLSALPGERAPPDFAQIVMKQAPAFPGGALHQIETTLRRLLAPSLVAAAGMAGVLLMVTPGPDQRSQVPSYRAPRLQVATLVAGPEGIRLDGEALPANEMRTVFQGQVLVIPEGSNASMLIGDGVEVEARGGSEMVLDPRVVHLRSGSVHVRVEPGIGNFVVNGPLASAEVIGTEFDVTAAPGKTQVKVDKEIVEVRAIRGGDSVQLIAGGTAEVGGTSPTKLRVKGPTRDRPRPLVVRPTAGKTKPSDRGEDLPALDSY